MSAKSIPFLMTVFVSALLLFLIQPLIAKILLPWFGGSASVWMTCSVFFQVTLLAGYGYGHLLASKIRSIKVQWGIHFFICLGIWWVTRVSPRPVDAFEAIQYPVATILLVLLSCIGLPFFILSSTSSLIQSWYRKTGLGEPYYLFAISNVGSLFILLLYPFVIEPNVLVSDQIKAWTIGFGIFILFMLWTGFCLKKTKAEKGDIQENGENETIPARTWGWWFTLSFIASGLFLAFTNHISHDIAVMPLLWIVPLALYLISFVLCFSVPRIYRPELWAVIFILFGFLYDSAWFFKARIDIKIVLSLICLLGGCMFCNGELYRSRPSGKGLTFYYFIMSLGGACGGIFVSIISPQIFSRYWELPILIMILVGICYVQIFKREPLRSWYLKKKGLVVILGRGIIAVLVVSFAYRVWLVAWEYQSSRNFYGTVSILRDQYSQMMVGGKNRIIYGLQIAHPKYRNLPTSYYGPGSGIDLAIKHMRMKHGSLSVAVIGLGAGTVAAYGEPHDKFRFFEINPDVIQYALKPFTFLSHSKAAIEVVHGDGRLMLASDLVRYDIIMVDAFTGDSVPMHLLTKEAFEVYLNHLSPDGIIVVHISNKYIDLSPQIALQAQEYGLWARYRENEKIVTQAYYRTSENVLLSPIPIPELDEETKPLSHVDKTKRLWTDNYCSWFPYLK